MLGQLKKVVAFSDLFSLNFVLYVISLTQKRIQHFFVISTVIDALTSTPTQESRDDTN